jgi:hypothetical protein
MFGCGIGLEVVESVPLERQSSGVNVERVKCKEDGGNGCDG